MLKFFLIILALTSIIVKSQVNASLDQRFKQDLALINSSIENYNNIAIRNLHLQDELAALINSSSQKLNSQERGILEHQAFLQNKIGEDTQHVSLKKDQCEFFKEIRKILIEEWEIYNNNSNSLTIHQALLQRAQTAQRNNEMTRHNPYRIQLNEPHNNYNLFLYNHCVRQKEKSEELIGKLLDDVELVLRGEAKNSEVDFPITAKSLKEN